MCETMHLSPIVANMLWNRGFQENVPEALSPALTLTQIPTLAEAAEKIAAAIKAKKRILVHGDYDADGITASAVLLLGFRALGANIEAFIPNRITDGYGIHPGRVPEHAARADLFITVDCGITNLPEITALQEAGVDVIVSDHHHPGQELPNCLIVHPTISPTGGQGLPELTGSGVAYHMLWALHNHLGLEPPLEYSDIATIGIIADVAPLLGENRALILEGLKHMQNSAWQGIRASLKQTRLTKPTARDVAFVIAPRLNAAGRLGEADKGLELLTTSSERRAMELAAYLDARNVKRREIQDVMFEEAMGYLDPSAPAIVIADTDKGFDWNPGIMGIVASKVLERFYKPVYIIAKGKGSIRSTPGISAVDSLDFSKDLLKRYGGHSQAAGFAIDEANTIAFRERICEFVAKFPRPQPSVELDAVISSDQVDKDLLTAVDKLEPYGQGHRPPLFALSDQLDYIRAVGKQANHLQLRIGGIKGVCWNQGHELGNYLVGSQVNAAVSLKENEWKGKKSLEFVAESLRNLESFDFALTKQKNTSEHSIAIVQDTPETEVPTYPAAKDTLAWDPSEPVPEELFLKAIPLNSSDTLQLLKPFESLFRKDSELQELYIKLSPAHLADLETHCLSFPSVQDLRLAYVCYQKGSTLPFDRAKATLATTALQELELIDEKGRAYSGQKRDPYSSSTLLHGLIEQYKLRSIINAYNYLSEDAFSVTLNNLFANNTK